ncbi:U-box domain-containing protein 4 [Amborella trichopoda]|uniref:RING-type E3 ubiquitin transferase n=1 Tax=Amborella trichopoda TaxID=13333 RepID=U5DCY4_AMBTC|nr:U-box domain-containing protein 4 [Amborella trichopoda]ERN18273.1 hypothetical protein AMTR_s00055p00145690 [Amborella trichopoda]|eukprot:XP_006856806.1 U-box domain-containing protein 4 [Amborella trichopoda]
MVSLCETSHNASASFASSSNLTLNTQKPAPRSMRTRRSSFSWQQNDPISDFPSGSTGFSLSSEKNGENINKSEEIGEFADLSQAFSDFSAYSSDISGELQRLAAIPSPDALRRFSGEFQRFSCENDDHLGSQKPEDICVEACETLELVELDPLVKALIKNLESPSDSLKRMSAGKLRLLAKNRPENRALIGSSGAIFPLVKLLRSHDPLTQENAVTALLNLSLYEANKAAITSSGAIKPLVYVLKTGTAIAKQNSACALLSLAFIEENKISIGAAGAIPSLVALLMTGSSRGKKDALTTLYKLCSVRVNKERAVNAGVVRVLVEMVGERGWGVTDKAVVVLSSLVGIEAGKKAIVEVGGIEVLVEVIEDGSEKGKEFAASTLVHLCGGSSECRRMLIREGAIPPLVALSQSGTARAKHKAATLLRYLREPRNESI